MPDEHATARALFQDYLERLAVLEHRRRYAAVVVEATSGPEQTPVEPLATMGENGGPLRCDICGKPMILEGGRYQGVFADEAWRRNPTKGWTSWISRGMVVRIETNGTLRIYHGYPGQSGCVQKADADTAQARADFRLQNNAADVSAKLGLLSAYFKAELPANDSDAVLNEIFRVLFAYDPGLGVNQP